MSILMLINLKGGVAKTTSSVAIAECLASSGFRTLLIDADHQCSAGELLLGEKRQLHCEDKKHSLYHMLSDMLNDDFNSSKFETFITCKASNIGGGLAKLAVMPCSIRIDSFSEIQAKRGRPEYSNSEILRKLDKYRSPFRRWVEANFDYTIIDCPPSLAFQVRFLLSVAHSFMVPTIPDRLSMRGSLYLLARVKSHTYKIACMGTLWSMVRSRTIHDKYMAAAVGGIEPFNRLPTPFPTVIPNATKIAEAAEVDKATPATFRHKYTPEFAKLFETLCGEIIKRAERQLTIIPQPQPEMVGA